MKTILVPTDFSENAVNAGQYAAQLSNILGGRIILFHSLAYPILASEIPVPPEEFISLSTYAHQQLVEQALSLDKITERKVEIAQSDVVGGTDIKIHEFAEQIQADLIVMGSHGHGRIIDKLLGSVTTEVFLHSSVPVFVVPEDFPFNPIHKILVGCYKPEICTASVIKAISDLSCLLKSELLLTKIYPHSEYSELEQEDRKRWREKFQGIEHEFFSAFAEDYAKGLDSIAAEKEADLVIVISRNRSFLGRLFHPSTARRLGILTHKPLLVIPSSIREEIASHSFSIER